MKKTYIPLEAIVVDCTSEGFLAHSQEGIDGIDKPIIPGDGTDVGSNRNEGIWGESEW